MTSFVEDYVWSGTEMVMLSTVAPPPPPPPPPVHAPVAQQTPGGSITLGALRTVRSLVSTCPEGGDITRHEWVLTSRPSGSTAIIVRDVSDPKLATYTPDVAGSYTRRYRCYCEHGFWSQPDLDVDTAAVAPAVTTADPLATPGTKKVKALMLDMKNRAKAGDRTNIVMVGQMTSESILAKQDMSQPTRSGDETDAFLFGSSGQALALRGYGAQLNKTPRQLADAKKHWEAGGIVSMGVITPNPWYDELAGMTFQGNSDFSSERNRTMDFRDLFNADLTPKVGSRVYNNFIRMVNLFCDNQFLPMQDAGIEGVILIPFAESGLAAYWYTMNPDGVGSIPPAGRSGDRTVLTNTGATKSTTWDYPRFKAMFKLFADQCRARGVHNLLLSHQPGVHVNNWDTPVGSGLDSFPEAYCDAWGSSMYTVSATDPRTTYLNNVANTFPNHFLGPGETGRPQAKGAGPVDLAAWRDAIKNRAPQSGAWRFWFGPHAIGVNTNPGTLVNDPFNAKRAWTKQWLATH